MSEDTTPQAYQPQDEGEQGAQGTAGQGQSGAATDLPTELREMGQQLEAFFRAAMESERARQLQRDLAGGARELSYQVQALVKTLQTNPRVQQAEERGRQAIEQARQSKVVQDAQETIIAGISQVNDQLRKMVDRLESERSGQPSGPTTQRIDVEHEPPTTGETTRLDE
jgi:hypothetical protein